MKTQMFQKILAGKPTEADDFVASLYITPGEFPKVSSIKTCHAKGKDRHGKAKKDLMPCMS